MTAGAAAAPVSAHLTLPSGACVEVTDDPRRVDVEVVWRFLEEDAYWGGWLSRDEVEAQISGAWRVVSAHSNDVMIGFARAVSDGIAVAYLADVFVTGPARGAGVAKAMLRLMIDDGPGADFRWMLHTKDAHTLYRRFGFSEPDHRYLERPRRSRDHSADGVRPPGLAP